VKKSDCRSFNQERITNAEATEALQPVSRAKRALECGGLTPLSTIADLMMQRQLDKFPTDFSIRNFKPGNARRRAAVRPGHAARIEKQNATVPFVARDVRVPVHENIDIIRRSIRRNVLEPEFQCTSLKVENQRPLEIAVAVSAHNDHGRSDRPQFVENRFGANIAKMPDLISVIRHLRHALRQTIVRVRENKHAPSFFGFSVRSHVAS
jgi:hypothetical protein